MKPEDIVAGRWYWVRSVNGDNPIRCRVAFVRSDFVVVRSRDSVRLDHPIREKSPDTSRWFGSYDITDVIGPVHDIDLPPEAIPPTPWGERLTKAFVCLMWAGMVSLCAVKLWLEHIH